MPFTVIDRDQADSRPTVGDECQQAAALRGPHHRLDETFRTAKSLNSPENIFIKIHKTRKLLKMESRVAVERHGSSFRSHGLPRVVKNCPISTCGCKPPLSRCGRRDFTLTSQPMLRCCRTFLTAKQLDSAHFKNCHGDPRFHFEEFSTRILIQIFSGLLKYDMKILKHANYEFQRVDLLVCTQLLSNWRGGLMRSQLRSCHYAVFQLGATKPATTQREAK